jgi:type VI secretion system secreted protein VgrG
VEVKTRLDPRAAAVNAPSEPSAVRAPSEPSAVRAPFEPSAVRAPFEPSGVRAPFEPSAVRAPFESSAVRAPFEPSAVRAPSEPLVELTSRALPSDVRVAAFVGSEGLSRPYRHEVAFYVPRGSDVDLRSAIGERASLRFTASDYVIHGVFIALEHESEQVDRSVYRATLAPRLWQLSLSRHSRVFTDKSVPDIVEAVLNGAGFGPSDYELQLARDYPPRDHVCQYRESDLDFVSRLLERDGIHYAFSQGAESERLVLRDDRLFQRPLTGEAVRFEPWSEARHAGAAVFTQLQCRASALPAKVELTDYDPLKPKLDVRGASPVVARGHGEVVLYGENVKTPAESAELAKIRAEQLRAEELVYRARGVGRFRPGYLFRLEEHPRAAFNREYLTVEIEHRCRVEAGAAALLDVADLEDDAYRVEVRAIESQTPYRPPLRTARPRVDGLVDGVADGDRESPYAQIDEHGRYRVKIFFDEREQPDGNASTWVRMLQPHGGGTEGMHFPLRKGTEVHIAFLGGDPDRPVIVGAAPNTLKPAKVAEGNNTQNVIMTGGSNRFELEDREGAQHVTLSTPALGTHLHMGTDRGDAFNLVASTEGNAREFVGGYQDRHTVGTQTERVTGAVTGTYESTVDTTVVGALTETFTSTHTRTTTGATTVTLASTLTESITGAVTRTAASTLDESIAAAASYTYAATKTETVAGDLTLVADGVTNETHNSDKSTAVAGAHTLAAGGAQVISSDTVQTLSAPAQSFIATGLQEHHGDTVAVMAATQAQIGSATVTIHGDGTVTISSADVTITGGKVNMTGGELIASHSAVTISGGTVDLAGGIINLN